MLIFMIYDVFIYLDILSGFIVAFKKKWIVALVQHENITWNPEMISKMSKVPQG